MVRDGEIAVNTTEADAVRYIFASYISGESYLTIAEEMENLGIRYHAHSTEWNKNMVKRILENDKYVGIDEFFAIITAEQFENVQNLQTTRTINYHEVTENERIICSKFANYREVRHRLKSSELENRVTTLMNVMIENQELLEVPDLDKIPAPTIEAIRLRNELNREISKQDFDADTATALVFALAAEKYAMLPNVTRYNEIMTLQTEIANRELLTEFDAELFERVAESVTLDAEGGLSLTLINGIKINENQNGEQHYVQQFT
jgi:hypothetical protein